MIRKPAFKEYYRVESTGSDGVFLLSELGHYVLTGKMNELVTPLIDGRRTSDEIASALAAQGQVRLEDAYHAVLLLEKQGHIVESDNGMPPSQIAFWHAADCDTQQVKENLREKVVHVTRLTELDCEPFRGALRSCGVQVSGVGNAIDSETACDFRVVVADDYLQPALQAINNRSLADGLPWMLVKPMGTSVWTGPIFAPGKTGCWECLAQRIRANREVEAFLRAKGKPEPLPVSRAALPGTLQLAFHLAASQVARWVASASVPALESKIMSLDTLTLETHEHRLVRRPQCRECGDPERHSERMRPISLSRQLKTSTADGGHRVVSPEDTYRKYKHHISPITGVVNSLTELTRDEGNPLRVYVAGHNFAMKSDSLYFLQEGLRSKSAGKGVSDIQARTSALCEAIERYSGVYRDEEPMKRSTYRALGRAAVRPNRCMLYSERQFDERQQWLARGSRFQIVPLPLREDVEIDWTPVWSLTEQTYKYIPTSYCYYGYPSADAEFFCWADSNGNASGNTVQEAMYQGFLEIVERDSVALWWYNRVPRPRVDLDSFGLPYLDRLKTYYADMGREFWVLDLTADLGVPVFAAINRRVDHPVEDIMMGFGAHFDAEVALLRAVSEMNQFMPALLERDAAGNTVYVYFDQDSLNWWQTATLENQPYLRPASALKPTRASDYVKDFGDDLADDVQRCIDLVEQRGMEVLVLDQTRPDVGLSVAKVIVPGMRHFWARFAPGRLYDVPVQLGWLAQPTPEEALNPVPMFL